MEMRPEAEAVDPQSKRLISLIRGPLTAFESGVLPV